MPRPDDPGDDARPLRLLRLGVLGAALAWFAARLAAPGWGGLEAAAAAARLEPGAPPGGPGHVALGALATLLPVGDVGLRVAALSAVAMVVAMAGAMRLARALVPDERVAGVPAAALAGTVAGPSAVAAALVTWCAAGLVALRRGGGRALPPLLLAAATLAVQPWLGAVVVPTVAAVVAAAPGPRRRRLALAAAAVVAALPAWWLALARGTSVGSLAPPGSLAELGDWVAAGLADDPAARLARLLGGLAGGSAGPLTLAGLLGLGLGAATGLRGAKPVLALAAAAAAGGALAGPPESNAATVLLLLASGVAVLAGAVARVLARDPTPGARLAIGAVAAAPVALVAALAPGGGPAGVDGPADLAATVSRSVASDLPGGPGVVVVLEADLFRAARYERAVAGERPDLARVLRPAGEPALATLRFVVEQLRAARPVGADVAAFDRLDPRNARPSGRGFQLLLRAPDRVRLTAPPAAWPGPTGTRLGEQLALARAGYEAVTGRLDEAARAAGLAGAGGFGGAELAVLAATTPTSARPAMSGHVPRLGPSLPARALLADDLAWVAGLPPAALPPGAPPERVLHARWRELLAASPPPPDLLAGVAPLGRAAVRATVAMLHAVGRVDAARAALAQARAQAGGDERELEALARALEAPAAAPPPAAAPSPAAPPPAAAP